MTIGLRFPAGSTARTEKVCAPLVSAFDVYGEAHARKGLASNLHWKVEPAWLDLNENVGVVSLVVLPFAGPPVIVAVGAVTSPAKVLNAVKAGFLVRLKFSRAALEQNVHDAWERLGSRQWYQKMLAIFQAARWFRNRL